MSKRTQQASRPELRRERERRMGVGQRGTQINCACSLLAFLFADKQKCSAQCSLLARFGAQTWRFEQKVRSSLSQNSPNFAQICLTFPKFAQICPNLSKFAPHSIFQVPILRCSHAAPQTVTSPFHHLLQFLPLLAPPKQAKPHA